VWALNYTFNVGALRTTAVAASHAAEAIPASAAEFTKNEKAAAQEQFSFVLAFDPAINVSPHNICKTAAATLMTTPTLQRRTWPLATCSRPAIPKA
jgi:hypothetical protein